jgi:hypothetical protein
MTLTFLSYCNAGKTEDAYVYLLLKNVTLNDKIT